jgi:hypothetical protein
MNGQQSAGKKAPHSSQWAQRAALLLFCLGVPVRASAAPPELYPYTVQDGDSCAKIAKTLFGDSRRIDIIHQFNPLGQPPHHLVPGQILQLPKSATPGAAPDAVLTFVRNQVEEYTPDPHPGRKDDPLRRGHKVGTMGASSAEITFEDETQLQLGEHSLVVILGSTGGRVERRGSAADTTLLRGTLRAHLAELAGGKPRSDVAVRTPAAQVAIGAGEAQVHVDQKRSTRLAVYRGRSGLSAAGKQVEVNAGYGSRADQGKAPTPPAPLPPPPEWVSAPPQLLLMTGAAADLFAQYGPGPSLGMKNGPAGYRVQLARDAHFNDLLVDQRVDGAVTALSARNLGEGTYFAQVSAIDADKFEGPVSTVAKITVARVTVVPAENGKRAALSIPGELACGLDGAPLVPATRLPLSPGREHVLRCAPAALAGTASGAETGELRIPQKDAGPVTATVTPGPASFELPGPGQVPGKRQVTLDLRDAEGQAVPGLLLSGSAGPLAELSPIRESAGSYVATLSWQPSAEPVGLRFHNEDGLLIEASLPREAAPPPSSLPPPSRDARFALELGLRGGVSLGVQQGHPGALGGVELGTRTKLPQGSLWIALRGDYERQPFDSGVHLSCPAKVSGCFSSTTAPISYETVQRDVVALSLPIGYRFADHPSRWNLYLAVNPALFLDWTRTSTEATPGKNMQGQRFALGGLVGAQVRLGPGGLFLEAGYRHVLWASQSSPDTAPDSLTFALGYRLFLW